MQHWYWLSSFKMTVGVKVENGIIVDAAPIVKKFLGSELKRLVAWMTKQGGFKLEKL